MIPVRDGSGFRRLPASAELLRNVNTGALGYAPALSPDGRALYYHKLEDGRFVIYRVAR